MKYLKKKKKPVILPVLLGIVLLAAVVLGVLLLTEGSLLNDPTGGAEETASAGETGPDTRQTEQETEETGDTAETEETEPQQEETEEQTWQTEGYLEQETPYCTLFYPATWSRILTVEVTEDVSYRVEYGCVLDGLEMPLFTVSFVSGPGSCMGTVTDTRGYPVEVYIYIYEADGLPGLPEEDQNTFHAMQEAVNELIERIPFAAADTGTGETETTKEAFTRIETPYCVLEYPATWERYLQLEVEESTGYTVYFYCVFSGGEEIELFSVWFDREITGAAATVTDSSGVKTAVHVAVADISNLNLSGEKMDILYSMLDAVNELIDRLQ